MTLSVLWCACYMLGAVLIALLVVLARIGEDVLQ